MQAPVIRIDTPYATPYPWTTTWQTHWRFVTKERNIDMPGIMRKSNRCDIKFYSCNMRYELQQWFFRLGKLAVIRYQEGWSKATSTEELRMANRITTNRIGPAI